jgi:hypothetical protein
MPFVKANPNEYLVVGRGGKVTNRGLAASAFLWPGSAYVLVPSTQQEAAFEMTQETKDGIPLRFKGIVIYRIVDPEVAARQFDFSRQADGHQQIKTLISHVCLGELRAVVARLTMQECIEQRKTTLTDAVAAALTPMTSAGGADRSWGISLDVVQVAQVFLMDPDLRRQLEAEVRNTIRSRSELSEIRLKEQIEVAQATSERRLQQETLANERDRLEIDREKMHLHKALERATVEAEKPLQLLRLQNQRDVLQQELEMLRLELEAKELRVRIALLEEQARQELRKELLPLEQAPAVAQALAQMFRGLQVAVYGQDAPLLTSVVPLVDLLTQKLRASLNPLAAPAAPAAQS